MPPAAGPSRRDGILVLAKVKSILDVFAGETDRAGPSEVAARIGANKSTTFRLLSSMERMGLLDRNPDGTYGLGLWLMELGAIVESRLDLRRIAEPDLRELQQAIGLTAFLTVRHAHQATCIDRLPGSNVDVLALRLGGILPLYVGAGPRTLLSGLSDAELTEYLRDAPFPAFTPGTLTTAEQLRRDVALTRQRGYVLSMEDVTLGVAALGAPVFDATGAIAAAISVAGIRYEFEGVRELEIAAIVRRTAERVSAAVGGSSVGAADSA